MRTIAFACKRMGPRVRANRREEDSKNEGGRGVLDEIISDPDAGLDGLAGSGL